MMNESPKPPLRTALAEALMLTVLAVILGFAYTAVTGQGFLGPGRSPRNEADSLPSITYDEARDLFLRGDALFVDARHTYDFGSGHIKGAISVPLQNFSEIHPLLTIIPKDRMLVTYCDGADCNSSRELAVKLKAAGYTNVRIFFDGWNAWITHSQPREP